ncbi:uncharacterized protein BDZ99DRAFT_140328 [Mytilinidion resinicola]|uniref:Uncharacterized protein n=1 Tax=Mytilinidion resinicola TaxID=574789 RepID=A0A6A6Z692_9PEZI|nr:uncharacterized protein BDZ99DRAFT_140328 [Mytilinidion resinicola]KAF2816621.1 hypothetical protein BDZ99DRAFT_140328 [Mytilinidion resinicola]
MGLCYRRMVRRALRCSEAWVLQLVSISRCGKPRTWCLWSIYLLHVTRPVWMLCRSKRERDIRTVVSALPRMRRQLMRA